MDTNTILNTNSYVVEDWYGGYKLHLDLTSRTNIEDWQLEFDLPYDISATYGVDIVEHDNGTYTIKGEGGWANLTEGQSIRGIFIIEDDGKEALALDVSSSQSRSKLEPIISEKPSHYVVVSPDEDEDLETDLDLDLESDTTIVSVERDFGGDLAAAIAAAEDGEVLRLKRNKTYYTSGLTIDKDITIFGREGTIIDGGGTSNSIINLTPDASGTTIRNVEITNGNNGIYSYGASNLTLMDLDVYNIGQTERISGGENNTGIILNYASGLNLINSRVFDVGRKGVSIGDTNGATVSGLRVENINLAAQHSQSHDAAGIKFYNTNDVVLKDSYFAQINANNIWNDTSNKTTLENNRIENVGSVYLEPSFDDNIDISGIYDEKSANSVVRENYGTTMGDFAAYKATAFTTESLILEDNEFSSIETNTEDYWVNEYAERLIATTEDPAEADFGLISEEYFEVAILD